MKRLNKSDSAQTIADTHHPAKRHPKGDGEEIGGLGDLTLPKANAVEHCLGREIAAHAVDAAAGQVNSLAAYLGEVRLAGSIPFPGDGPEVVTVGAITLEGKRASFSACGPNSCRPKPDLVAPIPFATFLRDTPFSGTSCATPQAASVAALCWSANPDWTASHVRSYVTSHARDLGPAGYDTETGYGTVHLPAIAPAPRALSPKPFAVSR